MIGVKWTLIFLLNVTLFSHAKKASSHDRPYRPEISPGDLERPLVTLEDGALQGFIMRTVYDREIAAFRAIPYAVPPVRPLRFQNPQKNPPWEGIRDAEPESPQCIQVDYTKGLQVHGQEDCLYLNAYVPRSHLLSGNNTLPLPVMVWFHGGAYFFGAGSISGPRYLLDQDVILVTVNYRLGPFGFLSTGDAASPGNQGMKDQVLALRWVQRNIRALGGNEKAVTIFGVSAGAASVGLHMVSPLSRGLFHRAIWESGSALNFWAVDPNAPKLARRVGETFNCSSDSSKEMVECLQKVPAESLVPAQLILAKWTIFPAIVFVPTVEPEDAPDAFLTKSVEQYYADGEVAKIPVMAGVTANEFTFIVSALIQNPAAVNDVNTEWGRVGPILLGLDYSSTELQTARVRALWRFYMGDREFNWDTRFQFSELISTRYINDGVLKAIRVHSMYTKKPIYAYRFSYMGRFSMVQLFGQKPDDWGVSHMNDPIYIFNNTDYYGTIERDNTNDLKMSDIMTRSWVRFAKYGNPNVRSPGLVKGYGNGSAHGRTWQPIEQASSIFSKLRLYDLNLSPQMIQDPYEKEYLFWRGVIDPNP